MTNVEKLQDAKVLPVPHELSKADEDKVNGLKPEEVDALIQLKSQLGDDFIQRNTSLIL
jgi:hypothetical protein